MHERLRNCAIILALGCFPIVAKAEPLLTISCDKPSGFNIEYGTSISQNFQASQAKQPPPPPALRGPNKDGFLGKPIFVIDSDKRNMTVVWAELPEDVELRKRLKENKITQLPPPPPATTGTVVWFMPKQISAIQTDPWSITTYTFFPAMGAAFIGQQYLRVGTAPTLVQMATFARCEYSWTDSRLNTDDDWVNVPNSAAPVGAANVPNAAAASGPN